MNIRKTQNCPPVEKVLNNNKNQAAGNHGKNLIINSMGYQRYAASKHLSILCTAILLLSCPSGVLAAGLGEHMMAWPSLEELLRVITLQDYNTRVVIVGTALLGLAAGLVGTFLLLRKRALLSDTLSHATLPGIALAFIIVSSFGGEGKNLISLIIGAAVFAVIGTGSVIVIQRYTRLKDDAALGIVLSVFFGLGIALLGIATRMESGNAAGLSSFIYGKTASMIFFDAMLIGVTALFSAIFCLLFFKEFAVVCFDHDYAATQGWPVGKLDFMMMTLVVIVTVVGLQAVGLILVVALLIIPPASARFWTFQLRRMLVLSGAFGAISGLVGAGISALMANLPAGAVIVLTAASIFLFSMVFGTARGLLRRLLEHMQLRGKILRENLLREMYEFVESSRNGAAAQTQLLDTADGQTFNDLLDRRSWTPGQLRRTMTRLRRAKLIRSDNHQSYFLTEAGQKEAAKVVRKHRLWETYLLTHADIAPGQVDWGADEIEHVLDEEMITRLEKILQTSDTETVPPSPHRLKQAEEAA